MTTLRRIPYYCQKHGKKHMVLQETGRRPAYHSEVWCNYRIAGKLCKHRKPLTEKQVNYFVRKYPTAEMHDYSYLKKLITFFPREWEEMYGTDILDD